MQINLFQAIMIGILSYLGSLSCPWVLGTTGGWYVLSRPLVSGFLIGLIMGDVQTGIIVGVAVQVVYIALVTPGGQMPQDLNAAPAWNRRLPSPRRWAPSALFSTTS